MTYVLSGYKWGTPTWGEPGGEVLWSIDDLSALSYNETLYDASDFRGSLQDAFDAWESVSDINFTYTDNSAEADFGIEAMSLAGDVIGEAYIGFTGYRDPGEVIFASVRFDSTEEWAPYGESDLDFYAVALHEIGHAIGLGHSSGDSGQIMYPTLSGLSSLGYGDVNGAQATYGENLDDAYAGDSREWITEEEFTGDAAAAEAAAGDGGGGGGMGIVAILLGLLAVIFGVGGGAIAAVAGMSKSEDEADDVDATVVEDEPMLHDLIPCTDLICEDDFHVDVHQLYKGDEFEDHDHLAWI